MGTLTTRKGESAIYKQEKRVRLLLTSLLNLVERPLSQDKRALYTRDKRSPGSERTRLEVFLLDPTAEYRRLDLKLSRTDHPESRDPMEGSFVAAAVGDVDGDAEDEIVVAVTPYAGSCYLKTLKRTRGSWDSQPILDFDPAAVDFLRSLAVDDIDQDGKDEIVIGTRPNGHVILISSREGRYHPTILDHDSYGVGTTNTREVLIADADNDGRPEILAAIARANSNTRPWGETPGSIFLFSPSPRGWRRRVVEDHGGRTHSRTVSVGDVRTVGCNAVVSVSVGVLQDDGAIAPNSIVSVYDLSDSSTTKTQVDSLETAIKSRSIAIGDVDFDGCNEMVLGTRNIDERGQTFLFLYRFSPETGTWYRSIIDTSGKWGFHCVKILDIDSDGQQEVIASDDGRGQIKLYKWLGGRWEQRVILDYPNALFVVSFDVAQVGWRD